MENILLTIGQRIKSYRVQKKLSQEQLAELAGCHHTYIGQIERGEKNATIETLSRIMKALNVPLSQLFNFIDERDNADQTNYALLLYDMLVSKSLSEQKTLYEILCNIDKYKNL